MHWRRGASLAQAVSAFPRCARRCLALLTITSLTLTFSKARCKPSSTANGSWPKPTSYARSRAHHGLIIKPYRRFVRPSRFCTMYPGPLLVTGAIFILGRDSAPGPLDQTFKGSKSLRPFLAPKANDNKATARRRPLRSHVSWLALRRERQPHLGRHAN